MGSYRIVLRKPAVDDGARFRQITEAEAVQTGNSEYAVKAFVKWILPRTARVDVMGANTIVLEPTFDSISQELAAIVIAQWS